MNTQTEFLIEAQEQEEQASRRKTTAQLRAQELRINKLLWENTTSQIKKVHPETGGSLHLCHNWGNVEAQKYLQQHQDRESKLFSAFREHYTQAFKKEYPEHMINR